MESCDQEGLDRIKALPRGAAHTVLLAICNDPLILKRAIDFTDLLLAPRSPDDISDDDEIEVVGVARVPNRKRKTPPSVAVAAAADMFLCENCERPFLASHNRHDACRFHDGELEPDLEGGFWDDHELNPDVWGPVDTPENRIEFPEGFYWDCCGKKADEGPGCRVEYHVSSRLPGGGDAKRSRLEARVAGAERTRAHNGVYTRDRRDDGDDDDSVVEVAAPLVTIDDDIDEDPPEELDEGDEFGAVVQAGTSRGGAETVVTIFDKDLQDADNASAAAK